MNCMDSRNNTPLLLATRNNNPKGIHNDPRHQRQQRLDIVQQLIAAGALVNVKNAERMTSLLYAYSYGDVEIVKLLLSHGGREAPVNVAAKDGYNPLLYAVSSRSIDIVQLLVEAGADINYANSKELKFDPKDWMKDMPRNAALHIAIANDDVDMLEFLLKNGADPNRTSEFEDTALKFAVSQPRNHQLSILKLLLSHGADMYRSGIFEKVVSLGDMAQTRFFSRKWL
ncbi:hypothetical protein QAD02_023917 [Eretmocerus hayati]|uniref:Uncharacterized protein n=1 Tax=Eretmocerus hayati TaxID=131215 RepID=A0ACC2Q0M4_9HYME|nr:hypothetical protein QAD02_023917 [Eretmocerus hayati]